MCIALGVSSTPLRDTSNINLRAGAKARLWAFPRWGVAALSLVLMWCCAAVPAQAQSYPPRMGCFVTGSPAPNAGVLQVQGVGFGAGQPVRIGVDGHYLSHAIADRSGSFEASLEFDGLARTVTATDPTCGATSPLSRRKDPVPQGVSPSVPPAHSGDAEPAPPVLPGRPAAAAIPGIPVTGLAPQLFLGMAGALLLAGIALTGLTGRLGHR